MKNKLWKLLTVMIALTMLITSLVGCTTPTEEPTESPAPEEPVVEPTEEPVVEPTDEPAPPEPVTMRIGTTFLLDTVNINVSWTSWQMWRLIYDSVVETGELGVYRPGLAESWEVSDDGLVWTFKIREGATFHDGTPCTAEEVAWSLNWMINVGNDSLSYLWWNFTEVVALDATTLQITTGDPLGNMEYLMFWAFIVPESVWGQFDTYETMAEFVDLSAATGTGPYKLAEYEADDYLLLEANENYWGGKPPVDTIIFQQYASEDAMVQALMAGEVDIVDGIPSTALTTLQDLENVQVEIMQAYALDELSINTHEDGTQPESLLDPVVRKAIEYAIDREAINQVAYAGLGTPGTTMIAPSLGDWHNSEIEAVTFNIEEANRILDEAGYVDGDGDGIREWSDGTPLEYRLMATEGATYARMLEIISDGMAQAGISAPPTLMDYDSQAALVYAWDYDLNMWQWGMDIDPDFGMVIFKCEERYEWGWNPNGYCNEDYDALYVQSATAVDHEERRAVIWEMQEMIYEARPWIVLVYIPSMQAYDNTAFTGFKTDAANIWTKWSIMEVEPVQ